MNENKYNKELFNTQHVIQQILDFLDRIRQELDVTHYEESIGRYNNDSTDLFKQNFYRLLQRANSKNITMDFLYLTEQFFNRIKVDMFDNDPTISFLLHEANKSLHRLYHIINDNDNIEDEEQDEEN